MKNKIKKNKGERWIQNIYIPAARRELILSLFQHGALSLAKIKKYIYIIAEYLQFI
jgi:predicted HTH domain antitoxin